MPGELRAPYVQVNPLTEGDSSVRVPYVQVNPLTDGTPNLRVSYVQSNPLTEGSPNLRQAFISSDALSEGFRNLRASLIMVEALIPIWPEEFMSTDVFPTLPGLGFTWGKRPGFNTGMHKAAAGVSVRTSFMQYPIWEFEGTFEFLRDDATNEFKTMCGFFCNRKGRWDTFLFKDSDDYLVTDGDLGTGDGVTTMFPLLRDFGGFVERIGQVDTDEDLDVFADGVLVDPLDYTLTMPNKIVFDTAPADGVVITASFQFFFVCIFKEDMADFDKFADKFWELQTIEFESIPPQ